MVAESIGEQVSGTVARRRRATLLVGTIFGSIISSILAVDVSQLINLMSDRTHDFC